MRLAAILLLFKEEAFVEACVRAIYPVVDSICVTTQYDRNYAGAEIAPDRSIEALLRIPDPENKIRLMLNRDVSLFPGMESESRLRNAAMELDPLADYYLIVDSDEIWPTETLRQCWAEVQCTQWAGYKNASHTYFRQWNYRIVEAGEDLFTFLRRGFQFRHLRSVNWQGLPRWKEYFRKGRKPKVVHFPKEWRIHHGSCVGDEARMMTKLKNWGHCDGVDPDWQERVWKNFSPDIRNFHFLTDRKDKYKSLVTCKNQELPREITGCSWPEEWIDPS